MCLGISCENEFLAGHPLSVASPTGCLLTEQSRRKLKGSLLSYKGGELELKCYNLKLLHEMHFRVCGK